MEDTQSRLQQDLRRRMSVDGKAFDVVTVRPNEHALFPVSTFFSDTEKSASDLRKEQEILAEMMRTVEKRDMLVSILEEQRLREKAEDRDLESLILSKGYEFRWAHNDDVWKSEKLE